MKAPSLFRMRARLPGSRFFHVKAESLQAASKKVKKELGLNCARAVLVAQNPSKKLYLKRRIFKVYFFFRDC